MGRPRILRARRSHCKAATLRRTLSEQTHSWRANKTFQGQPKGVPVEPSGAISFSKEPTQLRSAGPFKLSRTVQHARPGPAAPTAQRLPTSALPEGEAFLPRLASLATSGYTVTVHQPTRCRSHLRLLRTSNTSIQKQGEFVSRGRTQIPLFSASSVRAIRTCKL